MRSALPVPPPPPPPRPPPLLPLTLLLLVALAAGAAAVSPVERMLSRDRVVEVTEPPPTAQDMEREDALARLNQERPPAERLQPGQALGLCDTCMYSLDILKRVNPPTLPEVCRMVYKDHPDDYGTCVMVIEAVQMNGRNFKAWMQLGCYQELPSGKRDWLAPCPSRGMCMYLTDKRRKPFCMPKEHYDDDVIKLVRDAGPQGN